ncbi:hypothetical protein [Candidatus Poriferisodalis sp.]|uniref:hypothetical protein n=1 Tax=Candidatus Poriferisodalis sp. TaxID=3101277 RepID=UPI003B01E493
MKRQVRYFAAAVALVLGGSFLVTVPAGADDFGGIGPGGGVLSDTSREPSTTDHGPGSGGGEEQPADNDPIEELQPEGPVGPVGVTGAATYEAVWVPGEFVPAAVEVLSGGTGVELVSWKLRMDRRLLRCL